VQFVNSPNLSNTHSSHPSLNIQPLFYCHNNGKPSHNCKSTIPKPHNCSSRLTSIYSPISHRLPLLLFFPPQHPYSFKTLGRSSHHITHSSHSHSIIQNAFSFSPKAQIRHEGESSHPAYVTHHTTNPPETSTTGVRPPILTWHGVGKRGRD
jgi:hypothetical protein